VCGGAPGRDRIVLWQWQPGSDLLARGRIESPGGWPDGKRNNIGINPLAHLATWIYTAARTMQPEQFRITATSARQSD
jgi:hypothetical protein